MMEYNERRAAANALLKCFKGEHGDKILNEVLLNSKLEPRQRALTTRLFYGVLSSRYRLDEAIARYSKKTPSAIVSVILQIGFYQLAFCDFIPESAAVNETVKLCKIMKQPGATSFCNAVLRRFLREGKPLYDGDNLSVRYSVEPWIVKLWTKAYGKQFTEELLASFEREFPTYLRTNTINTDADSLIQKLEDEGVVAEKTELANCLRTNKTGRITSLESFQDGLFHVQDISSQYCIKVLAPQPGENLLDCCAAPGGKTFTAAQKMGNEGRIDSLDLKANRLEKVQQGAQRLGISIVHTAIRDARDLQPERQYDRVLCDAPCSGLGIIGKKPDLRYKSYDDVKDLPNTQLDILNAAANCVKRGGTLIYSTCTLNPKENEGVVGKFLRERSDFICEDLGNVHEKFAIINGTATLYPQKGEWDGFFIAKLKRTD